MEPDRLIKSPGSASRVGAIADRQGGSSGMIRPCVRAGISCVATLARQRAAAADERIRRTVQWRIHRLHHPRLLRVCRPGGRRMMRPEARAGDPRSGIMGRPETLFIVRDGCRAGARRSSALFLAIPAAGAQRCRVGWLAPCSHGMAALLGRRDTPAIESPRPIASRRPPEQTQPPCCQSVNACALNAREPAKYAHSGNDYVETNHEAHTGA